MAYYKNDILQEAGLVKNFLKGSLQKKSKPKIWKLFFNLLEGEGVADS